jgi:poly-D-alanine transfer protein DltD
MESVAADYPNVVIADWNEKASGNRDFFVSDGVHLSKKGALAYAQLINEVAAISPVS